MTITSTVNNPNMVAQYKSGSHLDDAVSPAAMVVALGFSPKRVRVLNLTTRVEYEWIKGMAATHTLKTAANGDRTDDTGSAIVVTAPTAVKANAEDGAAATEPGVVADSAKISDAGSSFTFIAAGIAQNDQLFWEASS